MNNNVALQSKRGLYYKDTEKTVGNLYQLRNEHGLSLETLADEIGVSRQAYTAWENGKREIKSDILVRLANYYNVSVDYLLGRTNCREVDNTYISEKTGLDEKSIKVLSEWKDAGDKRHLWNGYLNHIICHDDSAELFEHITELDAAAKIEGLAAASDDYNDTLQSIDDQTAQLWYISHVFTSILGSLTENTRLNNYKKKRRHRDS